MIKVDVFNVLLSPYVTEKTAKSASEGKRQYAFKVHSSATKLSIQKAVEKLFDVSVNKVRVVNVKGKAKRFGRVEGRRQGWKKAYVILSPGHDLESKIES